MFGKDSAIGSMDQDQDHRVAQIGKTIGAKMIFDQNLFKTMLMDNYSLIPKHRSILWRFILRLPMNTTQHNTLASQPIHPSIRLLPNTLPIRYSAVSRRLMRILSALVYWHPPLAECDWLPALVYPFLYVYERDSTELFEVVMTVIMNWCSEWLHFIPNPPITILSRIEQLVAKHGKKVTLETTWPALRSFMGAVATTDVAMMLIDNILSAKPVFLEYLVASYALYVQPGKYIDEFNYKHVINMARKLFDEDSAVSPNQAAFTPLPKGYYPVLPIVVKSQMWRIKELERIRNEAEQLKQQTSLVKEIETETTKIEMQRRSWMAERAFLRDVEEGQMDEFRRREKQMMMRENIKEERELQERREALKERKTKEENAITEWRNDAQKVKDETNAVVEMRREMWDKWLKIKEESAEVTRDEVDMELNLLAERDATLTSQVQENARSLEEADRTEQEILHRALQRSQELEDQKNAARENLERTRRRQEESFSFTKGKRGSPKGKKN